MVRKRPQPLKSRMPVLQSPSMEIKPDLLVAIHNGRVRVGCLNEVAELDPIIRALQACLEQLKDLQWARRKQSEQKR